MNPSGGSFAIPAFGRAQFSSQVNGQSRCATTIRNPHATAGTCSQKLRRHRNARKPPTTT